MGNEFMIYMIFNFIWVILLIFIGFNNRKRERESSRIFYEMNDMWRDECVGFINKIQRLEKELSKYHTKRDPNTGRFIK